MAGDSGELPPEVTKFLKGLRPDELQLLNESINFMRSAKTMGRFMKWVLITIVGAFIGTVTLGEAISKVWSWVKGTGV